MRQAVKKTIVLLLRVAVSVALIGWILYKVDRQQLLSTIRGLDPWLMLAAIGSCLAVHAICAWRWQVLLAGRGVRMRFHRLFRYTLNGLFFSNFLPTTVGGDLMRAYLVAGDCDTRTEALASVLVDRFVGLFGVIITGLVGLVLVARTARETALLQSMAIGVGLVLLALAAFMSKALMRKFRVLLRMPLLRRIEQQAVDFYRSLYAYRHHRREVVVAFLQSLLVQALVVTTAFLVSRSLGIGVPLVPFILYMPVIAAVSMVPASINGWGLQEGAFVVFFSRAGASGLQAFSLGFLFHAVTIVVSLLGGLLWLVCGGRRKAGGDACENQQSG